MLVEGRVRVAIMVTGACLLGAAGSTVGPAWAASATAVAACADAALPATVFIDGKAYDCAVVNGAAVAAKPPPPPPAKSTSTGSGGEFDSTGTGKGSSGREFDSTTAKDAPAAKSDNSEPPKKDTAPGEFGSNGEDVGDPQTNDAADSTGRSTETREHGKKDASAKDGSAKDGSKKDGAAKGGEDDATARAEDGPASDAMASYASLPASWTSLAPLSLPTFGVDGFPIPPFLLPIYQAAAAQYGVPWEVLASINEIETNFGRNAGISSAGAMGWMQFIYSSWERWGTDSDGDRRRDPRNPVDAIFAAARYLRDAGAGTDLPKAIFAYNHAGWYVNKVVERAREFAGLDRTLVAALTERALREDIKLYRAAGNPFAGPGAVKPRAGQALLLSKRQLTRMVLHSDAIKIYAGGRRDIALGHIDRRVLATLVFLERSGLEPTVSSLFSGHSRMTAGGNVSAHSYGHAVDIAAVNGVPIAGHQGAGSITAKTLDKLVKLQGYLRANQIISLMTIEGQDNTLSMGDHADHIHIGFPRVPRVPATGRPKDIRDLVAALRTKASQPQRPTVSPPQRATITRPQQATTSQLQREAASHRLQARIAR
ncbi:MAG: lytic transglycosylase domain-containing protein [Solirubrobacterales bacterium]|nr:lytic transglycosylase domain-containing protein [Solirubrobacterales bacterium]